MSYGNKTTREVRRFQFHCKAPDEDYADFIVKEDGLGVTETVFDIFRQAKEYYDTLIQQARDDMQAVWQVTAELCPERAIREQELANKVAERDMLAAELKERNKAARGNVATSAEKAALAALRQEVRELATANKSARAEEYRRPAVKEALAQLKEDCQAMRRQHRERVRTRQPGSTVTPLAWGTYNAVEAAVDDAVKAAKSKGLPEFPRHKRGGKISMQLQKSKEMTWDKALTGRDNFLRVEPAPELSTNRATRYWVYIRIGSGETTRIPRFVRVLATIHRELPEDGVIKHVELGCSYTASHPHWDIQFIVESEKGFAPTDVSGTGRVAFNLGWRQMPEGLRAATFLVDNPAPLERFLKNDRELELKKYIYRSDEDPRLYHVIVDNDRLGRWDYADRLNAERAAMYKPALAIFANWYDKNRSLVPKWMSDIVYKFEVESFKPATMREWKSKAALGSIASRWRHNRFEGDEKIFPRIEQWRRADKFKWDTQAYVRKRNTRWTKNLQRNVVAHLRRIYRYVAFEASDYAAMAKKEATLAENRDGRNAANAVRRRARICSPGMFVQMIRHGWPEFTAVDPEYVTQRCHNCGHLNDFDAFSELYHTCDACEMRWDQDLNACYNIADLAVADPVT